MSGERGGFGNGFQSTVVASRSGTSRLQRNTGESCFKSCGNGRARKRGFEYGCSWKDVFTRLVTPSQTKGAVLRQAPLAGLHQKSTWGQHESKVNNVGRCRAAHTVCAASRLRPEADYKALASGVLVCFTLMNGGSTDVLSDVAGAETRRIPNGSKFPPDAPPRSAKLRRWQRHSRHGQLISGSIEYHTCLGGWRHSMEEGHRSQTWVLEVCLSGVEVAAVMLKESGSRRCAA